MDDTVFNYTKIAKNLFFGFVRKNGFFIAEPEKAFLDILYLVSLKRYSVDLSSVEFSKLNFAKLKQMVKKFPKKVREALKKYE